MANFGPLSRGQPHSPDVNHCVLHFRPEGHREPRCEVVKRYCYNNRTSDDIEMKLGPVTKLDNSNKTMSKQLTMTSCRKMT